MIELPDLSRSFEYENQFWLSADKTRMSKVLAHYELFKMAQDLAGEIVECGVFKGLSLVRFAMMRELFGGDRSKKIIGFDTFGRFPDTEYDDDKAVLQSFVDQAGEQSIGVDQLRSVLANSNMDSNVELIKGDINQTVPRFAAERPELRIALLNLDTDIYEPAVTILEHFWPRVVPGGILILDDYGTFPGESAAVDEFFAGQKVTIRKLPFAMTPCYIVKGD